MITSDQTCPNCLHGGMREFYRADRIPVHSCMMLDNRDAATGFPKRDLALGFCEACGFISNVLFDSSVQAYSMGYEEQQSFSARFRLFQSDLVERLIDRYGLRRKDVVEIGCGKGDFLIELCEKGGNRGVGIDPACDPDRMNLRNERVRFIRELYGEAHAGLPCDFLCCRHTLEHIHPTHDFIALMRKVVGERMDMVVCFEVPAVERVLQEAAFWDIYYEHCSYFSFGSLARVFRANGFEVVELAFDYDDQYLVIVARPAQRPTRSSLAGEDDIAALAESVDSFQKDVANTIHDWRDRIQAMRAAGKRVVIWGSGSKCVSFLSTVGVADAIDAVVDINPYRYGKFLAGSGKEVVAPVALQQSPPDVVIAMNAIYRDEIQSDLDAIGVKAEVIAV